MIPVPPPLEAELRLDADPATVAFDALTLIQDLCNMLGLDDDVLPSFWTIPRGSQSEAARRILVLADDLFGGQPDHPIQGTPDDVTHQSHMANSLEDLAGPHHRQRLRG